MKGQKRIFRIPNDVKKEYDKFIGFHIDELHNSKLTLLGLSSTITKSILLREALFQYLDKFTIGDMMEEIATKAYHIWMANYKDLKEPKEPLILFKYDLEYDLRGRGLSDDLITKLITNFEKIKQTNGS